MTFNIFPTSPSSMKRPLLMAALLAALSCGHGAIGRTSHEVAERTEAGQVMLAWQAEGPVDVYVTDDPDAPLDKAQLLSKANRAGRYAVAAPSHRSYFLLRDRADGTITPVAERALPLDGGTNFRDLGGYVGAGGKHVRWGRIFRSGSTATLSDHDRAYVAALGIGDLVDLRSSEERELAPNRVDGVHYHAVGYPLSAMIPQLRAPDMRSSEKGGGYSELPAFLTPQVRIVFRSLLADQAPVAYFCMGGQDRTGVVSALILSALGVPRDVIEADYQATIRYRRAGVGMARITPEMARTNPVAAFFARYQDVPPQPLYDAQGRSLLDSTFTAIEARWGSVDGYLKQAVGLTHADLLQLREHYLE